MSELSPGPILELEMDKKMFSGRTHKILACQMLKIFHVLIYFSIFFFFTQQKMHLVALNLLKEVPANLERKNNTSTRIEIPASGYSYHEDCLFSSRSN